MTLSTPNIVAFACAAVQYIASLPPADVERVQMPPDAGVHVVTDFGAVPDDGKDDTEAFRRAIDSEAKGHRVVFVPEGTYHISDTVGWARWRTLLGETMATTVIQLTDRAPGFDSPASPKPVIQTAIPNVRYGNDSVANAAFDNYIVNLTIDTGRDNPGAIGLLYTTHNQGMVDRVIVRSGDAEGAGVAGIDLSQTEFGPGMLRHVTVEGFDRGINTLGQVSHATLEHITLRGQREAGIVNRLPMSLHGLRSQNTGPAVRNEAGWLAHLVLIDADLSGGSASEPAIDSLSESLYLRDIRVQGYGTPLRHRGEDLTLSGVSELVIGVTFPESSRAEGHIQLPIEEPPRVYDEPMSQWAVLRPTDRDQTAELQAALTSGAATVFLAPGTYRISATLVIPASIRRIVSPGIAMLRGELNRVGESTPFVRIAGDNDAPPLSVEGLYGNAWPNVFRFIEIATPRTVHLKRVKTQHPRGSLHTTEAANGGKLFLEEYGGYIALTPGVRVWARQINIENNPFPKHAHIPVYAVNRGADYWVLGLKTECPAIHAVTMEGGRTEILGGFFRDHFGPDDYVLEGRNLRYLPAPLTAADFTEGLPYFVTLDSQTSASYIQYAWKLGKARAVQGLWRAKDDHAFRLAPGNAAVGLYRAQGGASMPTNTE